MIVTSCPLRISLVGGSTDNPRFLNQYGHGAVISFPSNLRTYVTIHRDVFGSNSFEHKYNINYSRRESVTKIADIQNEMVRYCFEELNVEEMNCSLTSDIYSVGSGLAASSAYLQALIKAIYVMRDQSITDVEICQLAEKIERKFNPLVGQQDFYGSLGEFKRIDFYDRMTPDVRTLPTDILSNMDIYLLYTGVLRSSTKILETLDISKSVPMLKDVSDMELAVTSQDHIAFHEIINRSWTTKKQTSPNICENPLIVDIDNGLNNDDRVLSHKLCGAGNGGYFLVFAEKNAKLDQEYSMMKPITVSSTGVLHMDLQHEFGRI